MTLSTLARQAALRLYASVKAVMREARWRSPMKKYIIEREVPGVGGNDQQGLSAISGQSNQALAKLRPRIQWQESFVTDNKTFCVYLAEDEAVLPRPCRAVGVPSHF